MKTRGARESSNISNASNIEYHLPAQIHLYSVQLCLFCSVCFLGIYVTSVNLLENLVVELFFIFN